MTPGKCNDPVNVEHITYQPGVLRLLDQTQLPRVATFVELESWEQVAQAIARMSVRGAPAIGIAAAYGLAIAAHTLSRLSLDDAEFLEGLERAAAGLAASRPTAVNLGWALRRLLDLARARIAAKTTHGEIAAALDAEARKIHDEDVAACRQIGDAGAALLRQASRVLTHCNTGDLATGGYGTALGIIRSAWQAGRLERVLVDETRPMLQGARLTVWELQRDRIPYTLLADSMAAHFMQRKMIDAVIVGADRIARNGDTANKIGTYGLAVLAKAHELPFIVAAPRSTFDPAIASGADITIEQRKPSEVTSIAGINVAPTGAVAENPAFDVTPAGYITAIVTEMGVLRPPFAQSIGTMLSRSPAPAGVQR